MARKRYRGSDIFLQRTPMTQAIQVRFKRSRRTCHECRGLLAALPDDYRNETIMGSLRAAKHTYLMCLSFFLHVRGISGTLSALLSSLCSPSTSNGKSSTHYTSTNPTQFRASRLRIVHQNRKFYSRTLKRNPCLLHQRNVSI